MTEAKNVYAEIAASIAGEADTGRKWCQGSYYDVYRSGEVSACLVGHVDLVLRTAYVDGDIVKVTDDEALWKRRHAIVNRLASIIEPDDDPRTGADVAVPQVFSAAEGEYVPAPDGTPARNVREAYSGGESVVIDFNDDGASTVDDVLAVVNKAAELYPND